MYKITVCVQFITLCENKYIIIKNNIFPYGQFNVTHPIRSFNLLLLIRQGFQISHPKYVFIT